MKYNIYESTENSRPLQATYRLLYNYIEYTKPWTYEEWCNLPPEQRSAALYVQFYDTICLAWYKQHSFYGEEEEAVETILQYLIKNTEKILSCKDRFTAAYIYKISYNCFYCICHDRVKQKERFEKEISNIVPDTQGSEDLDIFLTLYTETTTEDIYVERSKEYSLLYILSAWSKLNKDCSRLYDKISESGSLPKRLNERDKHCISILRKMISEDEFASLYDI